MDISVFLADDHRLMVEGFRHALQRYGVSVVDVAYVLDGLAERFTASGADVLVIDVRFDVAVGQTGLDACEAIKRANPKARIVVFSQFDDPWIVERSYHLGALAFVRKDEDTSVLVAAIQAAKEGRTFFSPVIAQQLALTSITTQSPARVLEPKELEIFVQMADGFSLAEIAERMDLSYKTVATTVKTIKRKLGIDALADFTKLAIKFGLTGLDLQTRNLP